MVRGGALPREVGAVVAAGRGVGLGGLEVEQGAGAVEEFERGAFEPVGEGGGVLEEEALVGLAGEEEEVVASGAGVFADVDGGRRGKRSEEDTSELQSR